MKTMSRFVIVALCLIGHGCADRPNEASSARKSSKANSPQPTRPSDLTDVERVKIYPTRGVVLELVPDERRALIHHEEIPGFMPEMKMFLALSANEDLERLQIGHQYRFDLVVVRDEGTTAREFEATGQIMDLTRADEEPELQGLAEPFLELGDESPEFTCVDSRGGTWTPQKLRSKTWAVTFIFTRCPLPDFCPLMTSRFREAGRILSQRDARDWAMLVISIDPEYDSLDVLEAYRKTWGITSDPIHFCRAEPDQLGKIGNPLGLSFTTNASPIEHNLRTAVFGPDGRLLEVFSGNGWTAAELADSMMDQQP